MLSESYPGPNGEDQHEQVGFLEDLTEAEESEARFLELARAAGVIGPRIDEDPEVYALLEDYRAHTRQFPPTKTRSSKYQEGWGRRALYSYLKSRQALIQKARQHFTPAQLIEIYERAAKIDR